MATPNPFDPRRALPRPTGTAMVPTTPVPGSAMVPAAPPTSALTTVPNPLPVGDVPQAAQRRLGSPGTPAGTAAPASPTRALTAPAPAATGTATPPLETITREEVAANQARAARAAQVQAEQAAARGAAGAAAAPAQAAPAAAPAATTAAPRAATTLRGAVNRGAGALTRRLPAVGGVFQAAQTLTDPRLIEAGSEGRGGVGDVLEAGGRALVSGLTLGFAGSPQSQRTDAVGTQGRYAAAMAAMTPERRADFDRDMNAARTSRREFLSAPDPERYLSPEQIASLDAPEEAARAGERTRQANALGRDPGGGAAALVRDVLPAPPDLLPVTAAEASPKPTVAAPGAPSGDAEAAMNSTAPGTAVINGRVVSPQEIEALSRRNVLSSEPAGLGTLGLGTPTLEEGAGVLRRKGEIASAQARNAATLERARSSTGPVQQRGIGAPQSVEEEITSDVRNLVRRGKRKSAGVLIDLLNGVSSAGARSRDGQQQPNGARDALTAAQIQQADAQTEATRLTSEDRRRVGALRERAAGGDQGAIAALAALTGKDNAPKMDYLEVPIGTDQMGTPITQKLPYDPRTNRIVIPQGLVGVYEDDKGNRQTGPVR